MDRRTLLAVVLSLGIYYGWLLWRGPRKPAPDEVPPDPVAGVLPAPGAADPAPGAAPAPIASSPTEALPVETREVAFCDQQVLLTSDGAGIAGVTMPDLAGPYHVTPIYEWVVGKVTGATPGPWKPYGEDPGPAHLLTAQAQALVLGVGDGPAGKIRARILEAADGRAVFEGQRDGLRVRQELREVRDGGVCTLAVSTTWTNDRAEAYTGPVWTGVLDHTSAHAGRNASQHQPMALVDGSLDYGGALGAGCVRAGTQLTDASGPIPLPGEVTWYGISDRYFGFFVVPAEPGAGALRFERLGTADVSIDGAIFATPIDLQPGASVTHTAKVYAGPNHLSVLNKVHDGLGRVVDLGWFAVFGHPLLWLLRFLHSMLGDWGLSIVALTVLVKVLFFPMTAGAMRSGQKMQGIQPELKRLREEFANDPAELNRRTMELMQREGANPLTGCLPLLVQTPVFIALYNVLLTNVEFYQQDFLWLRDLSSPDPYCILPVTVTALMWGQQQLTPTPPEMDASQAAVLKWMPLMFGLFFFTSPSGLGVYFFVNMSLSILQQWLIKRSLGIGSKAPAPLTTP